MINLKNKPLFFHDFITFTSALQFDENDYLEIENGVFIVWNDPFKVGKETTLTISPIDNFPYITFKNSTFIFINCTSNIEGLEVFKLNFEQWWFQDNINFFFVKGLYDKILNQIDVFYESLLNANDTSYYFYVPSEFHIVINEQLLSKEQEFPTITFKDTQTMLNKFKAAGKIKHLNYEFSPIFEKMLDERMADKQEFMTQIKQVLDEKFDYVLKN